MQRRGSGAAGAERQHNIQEKMNFEIRIREGIRKLLTVSTQKDQLLQAVKNLMVCNARIHAYRTELQNQMEGPVSCRTGKWLSGAGTKDRMACRAKVALSDCDPEEHSMDRGEEYQLPLSELESVSAGMLPGLIPLFVSGTLVRFQQKIPMYWMLNQQIVPAQRQTA